MAFESASKQQAVKPVVITPIITASVIPQREESDAPLLEIWVKPMKATCIPSYVPGFDELIQGTDGSKGIPMGLPAITLIGGVPGSGKTSFIKALIAFQLAHGENVLFITFETDKGIMFDQIQNTIEAYGLTDKVHIASNPKGEKQMVGLTWINLQWRNMSNDTWRICAEHIKVWHKRTNGKIVIIDSITMLTEFAGKEMTLRHVIQQFRNSIANYCHSSEKQLAIVATSQHRSALKDPSVAGGLGVAHSADVVINIESDFVNNFDAKYYQRPRGTVWRSIRVIKTQNFIPSPFEHYYDVDKKSKVSVGKPIAIVPADIQP